MSQTEPAPFSQPIKTDKEKNQEVNSSDPLPPLLPTHQSINDEVIGKRLDKKKIETLIGSMPMVPMSFQFTQSDAPKNSFQDNTSVIEFQILQVLHHIFQALTDSHKAYDRVASKLDLLNGIFGRET